MQVTRVSGLAFVGLFIAAAVTYGSGAGRSSAEVAAYYADAGNVARQIAGFGLLLAGTLCLLVFVASLPEMVAKISGGACAAMLAAANALWVGSALTAHVEGPQHVSASAHLMLEDTGFGLFLSAAACAIPLVAATGLGPGWYRWLSVLAIAGLATAYWYFPWALFLLWVLAYRPERSISSMR